MSSADFDLVPTNDLIAALERRFDHIIFAGVRLGGPSESQDNRMEMWHGHATWCVGLALDIVRSIQDWARVPGDAPS